MIDFHKLDEHVGSWYDTLPGGRLLLLAIMIFAVVLVFFSFYAVEVWKEREQKVRVNRRSNVSSRLGGGR